VARQKQKVRLSIEALEVRATPAQLGQVVTLPGATGLGEEVARTAPAAPGGDTSLKIDHGGVVNVKIDASGPGGMKIEPHMKIDAGLKLAPSATAGVKIDPLFFKKSVD
jgi:hypothetical protein